MGPLRRIRSHDDPEVPAHEPKRDVADAPGIPRETRLGRRVEEETCFITDQTVRQALQPSQLNGGNLVDIFQNREDDFEAVETMEVSYTSSSGEKVQELVFAENSKQKTFSGPRILVSASRVNTMHRAISVLSRKVDNLTTTLRVCREHYYKELFSLRHGRQPSEEHEKFWFTPQAYQDTVSIQELRKRFGTEQEDLRKREQEVRELRAKLRQIDSIAEDRLEKLITCKTIPELFNWMRDMNGFREADFDLHLQVLAQEISLKATDANKAPDLEKEKLKSSLEDAEFEVESLQKKLMEAQVANQGLMDLLTERRAEPIVVAPAPIEEEPDLDDDSNPSSVATPVRSKEVAEMSQRRHSQATEDTLTILNRQAQAAAELAEAEEKNRQLQALADAWEKEAREQSRKNVQLERANKDAAHLQKAKDQAEKDAAKANQQKEALQKKLEAYQEKYKNQIETLRADGFEVESVKMSEDGGLFSRRNTIEEEHLADLSKGRLKPGKASKASSRAASKSSGKGSNSPNSKGSKTPRSPRRAKSKGHKPEKEEKEEDPGPDPFQMLNDLDNAEEEAQDPDQAVSLGSEAFLRSDGTFGGDSALALPEGIGIGVSRDEMNSFEVSLGLEDTDYTNLTTEGPKQLQDASVQTLITTDYHPPRWLVLQDENNTGDEWVSSQAALDDLIEYTKFKLLQWSVHFIKSEEPDVLKTSAALAALDHRMTGLGRSANSPSGRPGRLSTAVQRIQRMQQGNWQKVVEMEEARKNQVLLNQLPETKPMRQPPPLKAAEKLKRLSSAARRWVASPSASISTSEPVGRMSLAASPPSTALVAAAPRRDSRSLPPMHEVSQSLSPEVSRSEGVMLYQHRSPLPRMQEVQEPGDLHGELEAELRNSSLAMESVESVEVEWPRQLTESLLSSGSEKAPSSRQSLSEEPHRDNSLKDLLQFEKETEETHFDHFETRLEKKTHAVPKEAVHWTQGVPYALRSKEAKDAKAGNGLFTSPAKPLKVNNKEKWMPKVSLGGFSNLDTPSLISGHLDRFQEEFEAARSSTD